MKYVQKVQLNYFNHEGKDVESHCIYKIMLNNQFTEKIDHFDKLKNEK